MREPEPLAEHERLGDRDLRHREDHVVADLRGLAESRSAAMHDTAAHRLEDRQRRREVILASRPP